MSWNTQLDVNRSHIFTTVLAILDGMEPVEFKSGTTVPRTISGSGPTKATYLVGPQLWDLLRVEPSQRDWLSLTTLDGNTHRLSVVAGYDDWARIPRRSTRHDAEGRLATTLYKRDPEGSTSGSGYITLEVTPV